MVVCTLVSAGSQAWQHPRVRKLRQEELNLKASKGYV